MKQTAVEFLENKIFGDEIFSLSKVFEQAKEMEKQQIIDAYIISTIESSVPKEFKKYNSEEQYYNETFKK